MISAMKSLSVSGFIGSAPNPASTARLPKPLKTVQPHQGEMVVTSKSGEQIHLLIGTAPLFNAYGQIIQVMELSTNITQIRKLQENLSALGLMMSSMSHAVKGMLTALDGGIYRMQSGLKKQDASLIQDGLEDVQVMADRIRNAVLDILVLCQGTRYSSGAHGSSKHGR